MSSWKIFITQDSISPIIEQLLFFHDHSIIILFIIIIIVIYLITTLLFNNFNYRYLLNNQIIEIIWTIIPAIILIFIALPSLRLLYLIEEIINPIITIKIIGHQWFWSYEYSDFKNIEFNSYIIPTQELNNFNFRLLDVDNRISIPYKSQIRILLTASDVLHSWTIPSINIKIDAIPGRLNQANFIINQTGIYYGQCSEICGINHRFIPIVIERISPNHFIKWIYQIRKI